MTYLEPTNSSPRAARRGFVLAAAIACLFLTVLLSAGLAASCLERHRRLVRDERQLQAAWLAESALQRGAARLRADASYAGETWTVSAQELGGRYAGQATISVTAGEADSRRISVEAIYPHDPVNRARATKEIVVAGRDSSQTPSP